MDRNQELAEVFPNDSDPLLGREDKETESSSVALSAPQPATVTPLEIEDEETDGSSAACCRICLEAESEIGDELISPCMCKGTQQFVHRSCLDHWRSVKEGFAFSHCTTCKAQFHLRVETWEDNSWRKMKFRIFVARDVLLVFLALQLTIAIIGAIAYFLDRDGSFRNSFSDGWDRFLSKHPIPFYYCIGVVVFFVLLGFFGLIVHCSSFNDHQDPCLAGCRNCCYGWGILDCLPASLEACFALVLVFIVVFAILGIAYGFLAATMAVQRIWQRHYHILTKRELTKARNFPQISEYVVEDLHGNYTAPKLDPEHEERLKMLKLL
ncbi:putative E3 ubiquitin ligase SUD1 [Panicum miliaceum]|uniref:E3 ubiquitin ligase SUD1 n=1 Tax=Panicum miliaceum TaxID=4540 RepID=A0A3L6PMS9_PANMI|nr:putative E3 ubiquitin ligase SUD1 [Panicum miliaceum]